MYGEFLRRTAGMSTAASREDPAASVDLPRRDRMEANRCLPAAGLWRRRTGAGKMLPPGCLSRGRREGAAHAEPVRALAGSAALKLAGRVKV